MAAKGNERPIIIVKKKKKGGHGHHGGAWKVAYADFVTAMMAFFMVMWLVAAVTKEQRAAIFDYFKNPSMEPGKSSKPAPGQMGPGGASTSPINLHGGLDAMRPAVTRQKDVGGTAAPVLSRNDASQDGSSKIKTPDHTLNPEDIATAAREAEHKQLESLMEQLREAVDKSQALEPFKDQLLLDITPEGVRIQIVDAQNRPMFDVGSAHLRDYTTAILRELAPYLDSVPNRISLTGHTDMRPYPSNNGYTNWELSADRANAARRALVAGGLPDEKISRVVGLSSSVLFNKTEPQSPINRRISIVVMTKQAEQAALATDVASAEPPTEPTPAEAAPTPAAPAPAAAPSASATPGSQPAAAPSANATPGAQPTAAPAANAAQIAPPTATPAASSAQVAPTTATPAAAATAVARPTATPAASATPIARPATAPVARPTAAPIATANANTPHG
jgi:chemotaxis protein MotB